MTATPSNRPIYPGTARATFFSGALCQSRVVWLLWVLATFVLLTACTTPPVPEAVRQGPVNVSIDADGEVTEVSTEATNVRELLAEAGITFSESDLIEPRLAEPLTAGMTVRLTRVTESIELIPRSIPFDRKIVRSDAMDADDPARIVQSGQDGLQETRVRIVYHDGIEKQRIPIDVTLVEEARDEIVMVGIGAIRENVTFSGMLAYISDGIPVLLRGSTLFPEQLNSRGALDGRVFKLSPTGSHLLFTRTSTNTSGFNNSLWVIGTGRGATPRQLPVSGVLWADWNPAQTDPLQIAYTTAISTNLPPGWEANNDLWLADIRPERLTSFSGEKLIESYPATFGWWGGNFAWSPGGDVLAYSYANEVGIIQLDGDDAPERRQLQRFTEYNTLADWVWVPTLSWSADGRFLAFTNHNSDDTEEQRFDSWVVDVETGVFGRFVEQAGMWAHLHWSSPGAEQDNQLAYLQTTNVLDSQRSSYTLWLMDQDGSNSRQIYPPSGENSRFPAQQQFMAWGPDGEEIAFIFNNALHLLHLASGDVFRVTQDDARSSHPTWAPYGLVNAAEDDTIKIDDGFAIPTRSVPTPIPID